MCSICSAFCVYVYLVIVAFVWCAYLPGFLNGCRFVLKYREKQYLLPYSLIHSLNTYSITYFFLSGAPPVTSRTGTDSQLIVWYNQFHLRVPLENVDEGAYIMVELSKAITSATTGAATTATAGPGEWICAFCVVCIV